MNDSLEVAGAAGEVSSRPDATRPDSNGRRPPGDAAAARSISRSRDDQRWLALSRLGAAHVFGHENERSFTIRYWTGHEERPTATASAFAIVLTHPGALRRMLFPPSELAMAEAFVYGDFDIEGSMERAATVARVVAERLRSPRRLGRLMWLLRQLPLSDAPSQEPRVYHPSARHLGRRHARGRDAEAIRHHYDVGNDFYQLWLDREMVYSCAYFRHETDDLDEAQRAKLDHICRKLRLQPGERLLDVGCGWGGLIRHAARHFGVRALGITLSPAQASLARERISAEGLGDRCRVEVRDYRDVSRDGQFEKVVSVGMVEHVGLRELPRYFRTIFELTAPGGLFLNHGIVSLDDARRSRGLAERLGRRLWRAGKFIDRYVFPDGELSTLPTMAAHAERAGFEQRDVESLREHYALTLRHWVRRLESRAADAVALVGSPTYRVWRLYMSGSAQSFTAGRIGVAQMLLARPDAAGCCRLPLTREDLHESAPHMTDRNGHRGT